jgi:hypothetical protein
MAEFILVNNIISCTIFINKIFYEIVGPVHCRLPKSMKRGVEHALF